MNPTVTFEGGYAINSAGDDAPLDTMVAGLRARIGDDVVCNVICRHPNPTFDEVHAVRSLVGIEHPSRAEAAGRWFRGTNPDDDPTPLWDVVETIESSDLLVLGAGNFVNERGIGLLHGLLPRFTLLASIAATCRVPVMLYGLSASPLATRGARLAAQALVDHADVVTFREEVAIENLLDAGVELPEHHLLPDPALGAPDPAPGRGDVVLRRQGAPARPRGRRLALAPRDLSFDARYDDQIADTVKLVDDWLGRDRANDVVIVPQCTYTDSPLTDDRTVGRAILDLVGEPQRVHLLLDDVHVPSDVEACYETADVVVATRLHGSVFAARRGVPIVGLAYEDKVAGFYRSVGLPELCLPPGAPASDVIAAVDTALDGGDRIRRHLRDRIGELRTEVDRYVDLAHGLLTG